MKNILITGCSAGIGYGLTCKFLDNDYHVFAVSRNTEPLKKLITKNITIIQADITNSDDRQNIAHIIEHNEIDFIHNATYAVPRKFEDSTNTEIRNHFETNLFSPLDLIQKLANNKNLRRVLNISSGAAEFPLQSLLSYCSSKAAMHHAIRCLLLEYPNIQFANLRPGMVDTPLQERWRNMNSNEFPNNNFYIAAKQNNKLISIKKVSDFVYWVINLPTDDFIKSDWNINDNTHHQYWLLNQISLY